MNMYTNLENKHKYIISMFYPTAH